MGINETPQFVKDAEGLSLSKKVRDALRAWAETAGRVQTNRTRLCFRSPKCSFEIWNARIPDPDHRKGCSGGFRLLYFFNLRENSIFLDKIEERAKFGDKKEHPKDQQRYTRYLEELKEYLLKELKS